MVERKPVCLPAGFEFLGTFASLEPGMDLA